MWVLLGTLVVEDCQRSPGAKGPLGLGDKRVTLRVRTCQGIIGLVNITSLIHGPFCFLIFLFFFKKIYDFWLNFELFRSYFSYVALVPLEHNEYDDGDDNVNDNGLFTFYGIFRPPFQRLP